MGFAVPHIAVISVNRLQNVDVDVWPVELAIIARSDGKICQPFTAILDRKVERNTVWFISISTGSSIRDKHAVDHEKNQMGKNFSADHYINNSLYKFFLLSLKFSFRCVYFPT